MAAMTSSFSRCFAAWLLTSAETPRSHRLIAVAPGARQTLARFVCATMTADRFVTKLRIS
jgi:hypothetical protein